MDERTKKLFEAMRIDEVETHRAVSTLLTTKVDEVKNICAKLNDKISITIPVRVLDQREVSEITEKAKTINPKFGIDQSYLGTEMEQQKLLNLMIETIMNITAINQEDMDKIVKENKVISLFGGVMKVATPDEDSKMTVEKFR